MVLLGKLRFSAGIPQDFHQVSVFANTFFMAFTTFRFDYYGSVLVENIAFCAWEVS